MKVAVLDYGIGNLRSAQKAFEHVGAGAFGACVDALAGSGLDTVALAAVASGRPFLGICVGMQLLYANSDENSTHAGLGVFDRGIHLLPATVKRPQMQWNRLVPAVEDHPMLRGLDDPWVYFVHSYAADAGPELVASCEYGIDVTAAVARDNVWATQFHPEKSGATGLAILDNFVKWAAN